MWDLPGPGLEPVSPALAGGFLTTVPPRKSLHCYSWWSIDSPIIAIYLLTTTLVPFQPSSKSVWPTASKVHATHDTVGPSLAEGPPDVGLLLVWAFLREILPFSEWEEKWLVREAAVKPEDTASVGPDLYHREFQLQLDKEETHPVLIVVVTILLHPL